MGNTQRLGLVIARHVRQVTIQHPLVSQAVHNVQLDITAPPQHKQFVRLLNTVMLVQLVVHHVQLDMNVQLKEYLIPLNVYKETMLLVDQTHVHLVIQVINAPHQGCQYLIHAQEQLIVIQLELSTALLAQQDRDA